MRIHVILNRSSGALFSKKPHTGVRQVRDAFEAAGLNAHFVVIKGKGLKETLLRTLSHKPDAVVIGGGDGSINLAAGLLSRHDVPFGVLPVGTFNYYARHIGMPFDLFEAAQVIAQGNIERLDAVEVNGHVFISNSAIGLYPYFIRERLTLQGKRGWIKAPAMFAAFLKSLARFPVIDVGVSTGNVTRLVRTPYMLVGINDSSLSPVVLGGGDRASLKDNLFCLYICKHTNRIALLGAMSKVLRGHVDVAHDFEICHLDKCIVHLKRKRVLVATDGELLHLQTPLVYRSRAGLLRVLVPPAASTAPTA